MPPGQRFVTKKKTGPSKSDIIVIYRYEIPVESQVNIYEPA
jgi:hypothetical protein